MHWSNRVIGTDVVDGTGSMAMAAHSFAPDGSLHLIVREPDSFDLREFWWTDTTSGSGKLTGNGVPPTITPVFDGQYLGSVASYVTDDGRQHVVYVTEDRQLWELSWLGNQPVQGGNLLAQTLAPHPGASLSAYVGHDGSQHVIYLDQHRRVIELQWSGNAIPAAQVAGGDADHGFPADDMPICSHVNPYDNSQHAFYLSGGEIIELRKATGEDWQARSLTRISSGAPPLAVSGPASHVADGQTQHVFYVAASGEIIELWWRGNDVPQAENLTQQAHAPFAPIFTGVTFPGISSAVASHYVVSENTQHVFFPDGRDGVPWEIWWSGSGPKTAENLGKLAGAPSSYSPDPFHSLVTAAGNQQNQQNQHVIITANGVAGFIDLVARP
jgi:hypothetical protein